MSNKFKKNYGVSNAILHVPLKLLVSVSKPFVTFYMRVNDLLVLLRDQLSSKVLTTRSFS